MDPSSSNYDEGYDRLPSGSGEEAVPVDAGSAAVPPPLGAPTATLTTAAHGVGGWAASQTGAEPDWTSSSGAAPAPPSRNTGHSVAVGTTTTSPDRRFGISSPTGGSLPATRLPPVPDAAHGARVAAVPAGHARSPRPPLTDIPFKPPIAAAATDGVYNHGKGIAYGYYAEEAAGAGAAGGGGDQQAGSGASAATGGAGASVEAEAAAVAARRGLPRRRLNTPRWLRHMVARGKSGGAGGVAWFQEAPGHSAVLVLTCIAWVLVLASSWTNWWSFEAVVLGGCGRATDVCQSAYVRRMSR